jgi:hypothetical protein
MRLASLVPNEIPVEIWDENVRDLPLDTLREGDLVGITSMTVTIERAEQIARRAMKQGAGVVVGGVHATLMPEHTQTFAHSVMVGEGYFTWQQPDPGLCGGRHQGHAADLHRRANGPTQGAGDDYRPRDPDGGREQQLLDALPGDHSRLSAQLSFCTAIRVSGRRMRLRPVDEVVDEIERRQIKRFFLTDDNFGLNFTTDPDYCADLFEALAKLDLHGWTCQSEMSIAKHPELLEMSVAAHLDKHFVGFESVNPDNRSSLGGKSKGMRRPEQSKRSRHPQPRRRRGRSLCDGLRRRHAGDLPGDVGFHPQQRAGQRQHDDAHALSLAHPSAIRWRAKTVCSTCPGATTTQRM